MARVRIHPSDEPLRSAIERAVLDRKLDRRKVYAVTFGLLASMERFTAACSGCSCDCGDGFPCSHGANGCRECGYTGKRVTNFAAPVDGGIEIRSRR